VDLRLHAGDERVWLKRVGYGLARWTLRDLDGKVLREYTQNTTGWSASEDYLNRDSQLLATETRPAAMGQLRGFPRSNLGHSSARWSRRGAMLGARKEPHP
jgi:hypothetical protein